MVNKTELLEKARPYFDQVDTVWVSDDGVCFINHDEALQFQSVRGAFIHEFKKEQVVEQKENDLKKNTKK